MTKKFYCFIFVCILCIPYSAFSINLELSKKHLEIGDAYARNQLYYDATLDYAKAVEYNPGNGKAYAGEGLARMELGEFRKARELLLKGHELNIDKKFGEKITSALNDANRILALISKVESRSSDLSSYKELSEVFDKRGWYDKSIEILRSAEKIAPNDRETHVYIARTYMRMKNYKKAVTEWDMVRETDKEKKLSEEEELQYNYSIYYDSALSAPRDDFEAHYSLGTFCENKLLFDQAIYEYEMFLKTAPKAHPRFREAGMKISDFALISSARNVVVKAQKGEAVDKEEIFRNRETLAKLYAKYGMIDRALAEFIELIRMDATYMYGYASVGLLYEQKGDLKMAGKVWKKAIDVNPEAKESRIAKNHLDNLEKLSVIQAGLEKEPRNVKLKNEAGIAYYKLRLYERAGDEFADIIDIEKNFPPAYSNLAVIMESAGEHDTASEMWAKRVEMKDVQGYEGQEIRGYTYAVYKAQLRKIDKRDPDSYARLAEYCVGNELFEEALEMLNEAVRIDPKGDNVGRYKNRASVISGAASVAKSLEERPDNPNIRHDMGMFYMSENRNDKALKEFLIVRDLDKSFKAVYTNLALLYERTGNYKEALACWRYRRELEGSNAKTNWVREADDRIGFLKMLVTFQEKLAADPSDVNSMMEMANTIMSMKWATQNEEEVWLKRAKTLLEKVVKLESRSADARYALGYVYMRLGMFEESIVILNDALKLSPAGELQSGIERALKFANYGKMKKSVDPKDAEECLNIAKYCEENELFEYASEEYKNAIRLKLDIAKEKEANDRWIAVDDVVEAIAGIKKDDKNAKAYNKIGMYYRRIAKPEKAYEYFGKAVEADKNFLTGRVNFAELMEEKRMLQEAIEQWRAIVEADCYTPEADKAFRHLRELRRITAGMEKKGE